MEAQWGLQDGHWGRQVAAGGPPKVKVLGALGGFDEDLPPPCRAQK